MKRYKRILSILLVNLVILSVGLVMIELLFGAWLNPKNLNRLNLIKDQVFHYDVSGLYETPAPIIQYSRDENGFRGSYGEPAKIDLLTVGGSTTDQRYIADGATWQDILQKQCVSVGKPIMVANAGVDGQSTFGHIKNFDWWFPYVPNLKPRYVLFYIGLNDFYKYDDSEYDRLERQDGIWAAIIGNSALWHLVRTIWGTYRATVTLKIGHRHVNFEIEKWTREPLQDGYGFMKSRLDAYAKRLGVLIDRTRDFGSIPICVTQPSRLYRIEGNILEGRASVETYDGHQFNGVDYYYMMRRLEGVTEAVCSGAKASFIDLAAETGWEDIDFYDFAHMTPRGARKVGLHLFERLRCLVGFSEPSGENRVGVE